MNQELKNMELVLGSLEIALSQRDYSAAKTLSHTYERMTINYPYKNQNVTLSDEHFYQLEKVKELHQDIIENKIPKVISQNNYTNLNSLQLISERLYGILDDFKKSIERYKLLNGKTIAKKITVHEDEKFLTKNDTKQLLELSINNGVLITQVDEKLRGTGKTVSLIKKAHELDVTLLVGTHSKKRIVDEIAAQMGLHIDCRYINNLDSLKGRRLKNGKFLVDDSVPNIIIQELRKQMNEFVGGFNSLSDSLYKVKPKTELEFLNEYLLKLQNELDVLNTTYIEDEPVYIKINKGLLIKKIKALKELVNQF